MEHVHANEREKYSNDIGDAVAKVTKYKSELTRLQYDHDSLAEQ